MAKRSFLSAGALLVISFASASGACMPPQSSSRADATNAVGPVAEARADLAHGQAEDAIRILTGYLETQPNEVDARILLGQAYAGAGQSDRAEEVFQTVLQASPENYVALAALGEIYERAGQSEKAEPLLAHAAEASKGVPEIRIEWAVVLVRLRRFKEAQGALTGLTPPRALDERVRYYRLNASVASGLGDSKLAASEMEKALNLKPGDPGISLATAMAEVRTKNGRRAAELAKPLYSQTHDPQVGMLVLEAELEIRGDYHATLAALRAIPLQSTDQMAFRQQIAQLLISHGQFRDAVEDLKAVAELDPSRPELQFNLALAQFRAGRLDDALASAEKCKELRDDADLEDLLGDIQEARKDYVAAVKSYQAAVALAPNEEKYRLSLAVELIRHNNLDAAGVVLKQAEGAQPSSWRIELALGMVEYFGGTDEEATRYLMRAADIAPEPEAALKYLGDVQMERPSTPDAAALAKLCEVADRDPGDGQMQFYCGAVLFRRDYVSSDKSHADEILRRLHVATGLIPKDAGAHCQLGRAYRWLDRWQDALGESETCARLDPNSADAHYRLAQIYNHFGQQEKRQREMKLYEAASTRVADENAKHEATLKTFLYTMQKDAADQN